MTSLISQVSLAYVNHGRWIAECPYDACNNALRLHGGEVTLLCRSELGGCGRESLISWPYDAQGIWDALQRRPRKETRNWFPAGHPVGERFRLPMGQTPRDLIDEQKTMEELGQ